MEDVKPKADWDSEHTPFDKGLVWWSRLDKRFQVEVWDEEDKGVMYIFDHNDNNKLLTKIEVGGFSYGAIFGPDMSDVEEWQEEAIKFVDSLQQ